MNTCNALSLPAYTINPQFDLDGYAKIIQNSMLPSIAQLKAAQSDFLYSSPESFTALTSDEAAISKIKGVLEDLLALKPTDIIVCGIGGSSQGSKAFVHALYGEYNLQNPRCYFCETVDPLSLGTIVEQLARAKALSAESFSPVLCIVSKSGTTQETLINAAVLLDFFKTHTTKMSERVVCVTQKGSSLSQVASKEKFGLLFVPEQVSGRFSTFSAVGLLPLALMGININLIALGAQSALTRIFDEAPETNPIIQYALWLFEQSKTHAIAPFFVSMPSLASSAHLFKQLYAESLGKKDKKGNRVGFHPTVSVMTQDLHSIFQLYLDGPQNHMTTFIKGVSTAPHSHTTSIPTFFEHQMCKEASAVECQMKFVDAVLAAYTDAQIPHTIIALGAVTARILGSLITEHMVTTALLGKLYEISTFDQPAITLYKCKL